MLLAYLHSFSTPLLPGNQIGNHLADPRLNKSIAQEKQRQLLKMG